MNSTAIKVITIAIKVASVITGLAAYNDLVPTKYAAVAALAFGGASIAKDALTPLEAYPNRATIRRAYDF